MYHYQNPSELILLIVCQESKCNMCFKAHNVICEDTCGVGTAWPRTKTAWSLEAKPPCGKLPHTKPFPYKSLNSQILSS